MERLIQFFKRLILFFKTVLVVYRVIYRDGLDVIFRDSLTKLFP